MNKSKIIIITFLFNLLTASALNASSETDIRVTAYNISQTPQSDILIDYDRVTMIPATLISIPLTIDANTTTAHEQTLMLSAAKQVIRRYDNIVLPTIAEVTIERSNSSYKNGLRDGIITGITVAYVAAHSCTIS